jgi:hypothetical protein
VAAVGLFFGGLSLWSALMIRQALWVRGLGPICGHRGLLLTVHCPGCYVAAAMMFGAAVLMATAAVEPVRVRLKTGR